jgi:magnesium transporter
MSEDTLIKHNFINGIKENGTSTDTFERRWFCVAINQDGTVFMEDADSPTKFMEVIHNAQIAWVDLRTSDLEKEAAMAGLQLGFSSSLLDSFFGDEKLLYEDLDVEMGIKLFSIQIRLADEAPDVKAHTTLLLLRKNFIFSIHPMTVDRRFSRLRRYSHKILQRIPVTSKIEDKLTLLLIRIIDQNNDRNFEHLRQIEERGDDLNKRLMDPATPRTKLGPQIYGMKHALIVYLDALWETVDVLHDVRYGDAELLSDNPQLLQEVTLLTDNVNNQIGLAEHLSEVLASGLEVLQSIYNNQLQVFNNRMALIMTYLTILGTAVLVPNTLATIFSNPAFNMGPEDMGWYVTMLVSTTVLSTILAFWWVRRRKMPKIAE